MSGPSYRKKSGAKMVTPQEQDLLFISKLSTKKRKEKAKKGDLGKKKRVKE